MNYYPFHIGDFRSGTFNMNRLTRWIYRDMLDVYYDTETPLPLDLMLLCDLLGVDSNEERTIVERLLRLKFTRTDGGYMNSVCDRVIEDYRRKAAVAQVNGKRGGRPKKEKQTQDKPTGNPVVTDEKPSGFPVGFDQLSSRNPAETGSKANQEPITNNQEPEEIPPIPPTGGGVGDDLPEPHALAKPVNGGATHSLAGIVCQAIKKTGIGLTNPSHPKLNALLHAGATIEQFEEACRSALAKGKNFTYALGIVEREMGEARELSSRLGKKAGRPSEKSLSDPARYGSGVRAL